MALPGPGDRGETSYSSAIDYLRSKLGGFYFESEGTPPSDLAFVNLLRLRALWEMSGESPPNLIVGVQDAMYGTGDSELRSTVDNLFGKTGAHLPSVKVNGLLGKGDGQAPARTLVDLQIRQLESVAGGDSLTEIRLGEPDSPAGTDGDPLDNLFADALADMGGGDSPAGTDGDPLDNLFADALADMGGGDSPAVDQASGGGGGPTATDSTAPSGPLQGDPSSARQVPGGGKLWNVAGRNYLAYKVPGTNVPLVWEVEDDERLQAIFGTGSPNVDRTLTEAEFKRLSPWQIGGLSSELAVTAEDPWRMFLNEFDKAAELRPWLNDPSMMATVAVAYLEGRTPTRDELSLTDWWNDHTEDERAWMERSATAGDAEVRRMHADARVTVAETLAAAGMDNAHDNVVDYIATQRLTGAWSETEADTQIRKLVDPYAPGRLDDGLLAALRDPAWVTGGDAKAISGGRQTVLERLSDIFDNRNVEPGTGGEDRETALGRIADQVMGGNRTIDDVRRSADYWAERQDQGRPGGLDITQEGEDAVRALASRWLGPEIGRMGDDQVAQWAGRIRNDPDAQTELVDSLRQQRLAMLPGYSNQNLTYEDIVQPVRNLASNVWGQPIDDESLLVDLANTMDYSEMAKRLRQQGLERGIAKPVQDALSGLMGTAAGERVQRSTI